MIPVSFIHFAVTAAYVVIFLAACKVLAITFPDTAGGRAIGFLTF